MTRARTRLPHAVLLTGATGSLGNRICARLLADTAATVHCLVRAADTASASARLAAKLRGTGLPEEIYRGRVVAVPGDLAGSRLGLATRSYDALAETTGLIVHCAATVNLAADYEQLAPVNLGGTRALIAFAERAAALTGRPPHLSYVSTLGTLLGARAAGHHVVDEHTEASPATAGPLGYPRSKAAAERELRAAAARGARVTILRPGVITADGHTGTAFDSDLLVPLLGAVIALRAAPRTDATLPFDTADTVARAVVRLVGLPESADRTFHLVRPRPLALADLFDAARRAGHHLDPLPVDRWWQLLDAHADHPAAREMITLSDVYRYTLTTDTARSAPDVRSDETWHVLKSEGIDPPDASAAFLDCLLKTMIGDGVRPAPVTGIGSRRAPATRTKTP